jgi:hypothetical protein
MREIKFRAWSGNKMLVGQDMMNKTIGQLQTWSELVMQFTGLKDKKGKEVYEGDIVKETDSRGTKLFTVTWDSLGTATGFTAFGTWNAQDSEVIGNIYENPDLIK